MTKNISLSIPQPCSEQWQNFTPTPQGGFCGNCNKIVVDFTKMSDREIVDYFSRHQQIRVCGRLHANQLKAYDFTTAVKIKPGFRLLKAGIMSLVLFTLQNQAVAQYQQATIGKVVTGTSRVTGTKGTPLSDPLISGTVKSSDDGLPLPGVNILLKGTSEGTISDAQGKFTFPRQLKNGDTLVFHFIGFESQEYVVAGNNNPSIEMMMLPEELLIMGEVAADGIYEPKPSLIQRWIRKVKSIF